MFDRNETHNSEGKQVFTAVPYAPQACAARGPKVVDGAATIRHQLPLQTAFWRGDT